MTVYRHSDFCRLPEEHGIYYFYLDPKTLTSNTLLLLIRRLRLTPSIFNVTSRHPYGFTYEFSGSVHPSVRKKGINDSAVSEKTDASLSSDTCHESIKIFRNLLISDRSLLFSLMPPLYVGLTREQTLLERILNQHIFTLQKYTDNSDLILLRENLQDNPIEFFSTCKEIRSVKNSGFPIEAFFCGIKPVNLCAKVFTYSNLGLDASCPDSSLILHGIEDIMQVCSLPPLGKD